MSRLGLRTDNQHHEGEQVSRRARKAPSGTTETYHQTITCTRKCMRTGCTVYTASSLLSQKTIVKKSKELKSISFRKPRQQT